MEFHKKLEREKDIIIKKKYIHIQAPLCSKAKALFKENKWTIWEEELTSSIAVE